MPSAYPSSEPSASWRQAVARNELEGFLKTHDLDKLLPLLVKHEVDSMETLRLMTDADLKEVGVPKGKRLRLLDALGVGAGGGGGRRGSVDAGAPKCKVCLNRTCRCACASAATRCARRAQSRATSARCAVRRS